ncbi:MATE family efflux transporter [Selenihalanaerobacter shriftii]|uniref:Putative efflux protein, MATE family n=1 Tax=Selenihalanaerobacter shriftii TaxID=142842 RepID=A0A1T4LSC0_9FIRM|nr:MATE family efflux transporter [Selenihalanaerobacter shriftii]SJZ57622.1 putative efflux protein, MATE family [Selenihalanaerobacter shriftii]
MADKRKLILEGKILPTLLKLSLPIIIGMLMQTMFNIVDTYFVGKLGANGLAAISLTFPVVMFMVSIGNGIAIGGSSLLSRLLGSNQYKEAKNAILHTILLAFLVSFIFTIFGLRLAPKIFKFMGATTELMPLTLDYITIIFSGSLFIFLFSSLDGILRGQGNMTTSMINLGIATIVNILLDPFLIFGLSFFPRLDMKGAALATVIARGIATIWTLFYFLKSDNVLSLDIKSFKFDFNIIIKIIKVGFPASISQAIFSVALVGFNKLASAFGPNIVAAFGLGFRLDTLAVLPGLGLAATMTTMVGYNFGANKLNRTKKITTAGLKLIFGIMSGVGIIFFFIPKTLVKLFNSNPEVIKYGVQYFKYVSLTYGFLGLGFLSIASFQGIGHGSPAFINNLIRFGIVALPLSWLLIFIFDTGPSGLWTGMAVSNVIFGVISTTWFFYVVNNLLEDIKKTS